MPKKKYQDVTGVILAAGEGTRMKSALPKVMHHVCGRPMLGYVFDLTRKLRLGRTIVVLGHRHEIVRKFVGSSAKVALQKKRLGTADALRQALPLAGVRGTVLVLYGDIPLLKSGTVEKLLEHHRKNRLDATILTCRLDKPAGYGRILRDRYSSVRGIVEEKDADSFQKEIKEINTGIICFEAKKLASCIRQVRPDNRKHEYYLTDLIKIFYRKGYFIESVTLDDINEALGINSRQDLAKANAIMRRRINEGLMQSGVTIVDPETTFIGYGTRIGQDTSIYPFTVIETDVTIGKRCSIGPFAHLNAGTNLKDEVVVGNFIEIVRSQIGSGTFVKHFGYLGDARVGKNVNIGAGCVTANFDGKDKYRTRIDDGAFIGSDTILIAPISVGKAARTGAGAVVLKNRNVPAHGVVAGVPAKPIGGKTRGRTRG